MFTKMDTNNLGAVAIWLQSLGLLYKACEPLTYDLDLSSEDHKNLISDIERHAYYCSYVKDDMDKGILPKTWDDWASKKPEVEERNVRLDPIDSRSFGDVLTKIFE